MDLGNSWVGNGVQLFDGVLKFDLESFLFLFSIKKVSISVSVNKKSLIEKVDFIRLVCHLLELLAVL